jgi:serine/threonine protein phosphatase 1
MTQNNETNCPERLLAIGDIHGCRDQLAALLEKIAPTHNDQVVFLGDYIDRGPDSAGVISDLVTFRKVFPATIFLRGNHEQMFADYLEDQDPTVFLLNGGAKTLNSYHKSEQWPIPPVHLEFLNSLLNFHETQEFIFVHAGLRPNIPLAEQNSRDLLWIRQDFIESDYDWGKSIVYGHTPLTTPLLTATRLGLDTGCVYGRQLTCCDVISRQIWQV